MDGCVVRLDEISFAEEQLQVLILYWESDIYDDYGIPEEAPYEPFCPGYVGGECPDPEDLVDASSNASVIGDFR